MCALTVVLYLVLIVSSPLHSPGRCVNHSLLRSSPALLSFLYILLIFLSAHRNCGPLLCGLGALGKLVEWRVIGEGLRANRLELTEICLWWQQLEVFRTHSQAEVISQLHTEVDLMVLLGKPRSWTTTPQDIKISRLCNCWKSTSITHMQCYKKVSPSWFVLHICHTDSNQQNFNTTKKDNQSKYKMHFLNDDFIH